MKITEVSVIFGPQRQVRPLRWRDGLPLRPTVQQHGFLKISTDEGIDGYADVGRPAYMRENVDRHLRDELVGQDPLARELLWHRLWEVNRVEYYPTNFVGIVDVALWDIAGKAAGLPVYRLLGAYRDSLPAYASTITFGSVEEYLDVADQCLALGYRAIKLHAWGDARRDAQLSQAVREHVGSDVPLMFDGSGGFDLPDAIYLGQSLTENGYLWYEEPMREFSITSYRLLGERVGVPLLVAEITEGAHQNAADFIASGCATYVRTSAGFKAGITGAMRIAHLADSFQLRAEVHGPGMANEHLCMAISNTSFYESLVTTNPVIQDPRLTAEALLPAPQGPGIGWSVDG